MEMTGYVLPTSWDDKGMDWENPDPECADYWTAIRLATAERWCAAGTAPGLWLTETFPCQPVARRNMDRMFDSLYLCVQNYVNLDFDGYREDFSDFPRYWSLRELVNTEGCGIAARPGFGSPCRDPCAWLKAARALLDKLTVVPVRRVSGYTQERSASAWGGCAEAVDGAVSAMLARSAERRPFSRLATAAVRNYTSVGHTTREREGYEASYDASAGQASVTVTGHDAWCGGGRAVNFLAAVAARVYDDASSPTKVVEDAAFDAPGTGFRPGLNIMRPKRVANHEPFEYTVGGIPDECPKVAGVPESEFVDDGGYWRRTVGHYMNRGYRATAWFFADYDCEGGFMFRPGKESSWT